jgi:hypothetical protein
VAAPQRSVQGNFEILGRVVHTVVMVVAVVMARNPLIFHKDLAVVVVVAGSPSFYKDPEE